MRPVVTTLASLLASLVCGAAPAFNYAEALQKSLFFYEAQQSGRLSPNNRVAWRGAACLTDGQDVGRDLSGGWFDAGDHWTANLTMSFAAMTLAWSAVEHPEAYRGSGQMDELIEGLIHVNDYFLRCVLNPDCADPAVDLEVAIGCGGREGVESPNVHAMWAPAEVAHLMTRRPTFRVNRQVPAGDIPAAMAAAMAASSMVIREHAGALTGKRGFETFRAAEFADRLLDRAEKLVLFARANAGPVLADSLPQAEQERTRKARSLALRSDGKVVETGYRADPWDKIVAAAAWLQRAHRAKNAQAGSRWFDFAAEVYEHEYKAESNHDWWKDYGAGNFGKLAAFCLMRLAPEDERFHAELQLYCSRFCEYRQTPGGLRLREWDAHEYGSLRHANNAAAIALYYSDHVTHAPPIKGNTWWKGNRSNAELAEQYRAAGKHQVDYALGANPYGRSFLVGFGQEPFNHVHHRGAYGAWAGFDHFIPGKADDRATNRHILYGALVAGPDHNDVFVGGREARLWLPITNTGNHGFFYRFANRPTPIPKEGYVWDAGDPPHQDVMDSTFNEVALDYNAGITASFAWLTAHGLSAGGPLTDAEFPPRERRDVSNDRSGTDREFFVTAKQVSDDGARAKITAIVWNRSRWPARVTTNLSFMISFPEVVPTNSDPPVIQLAGKAHVAELPSLRPGLRRVEIAFPGDEVFPGSAETVRRVVTLSLPSATWRRILGETSNRRPQEEQVLPAVAVYDSGRQLGGDPP